MFGLSSPEAAIIVSRADHHNNLVNALKLALNALNTAPRFRVGKNNSYAIASHIEDVLRQAGEVL